MSSLEESVKREQRCKSWPAFLPMVLVVVAGYVVVWVLGAGPTASSKPEKGVVAAGATVMNGFAASGGDAPRFTTPSTPVSTPITPPSLGTCSGALHTPGGPDGAGGCWPGPTNTGVPAGTVLSVYSGSCVITTAGTVIDAKTLNCDLDIRAANVTVTRSKINGLVYLDSDAVGSGAANWSVTVQDSEVDGGAQQRAAISTGNVTVIRSNIHGGITAVQCDEHNVACSVQDSYLHGQYMPQGVDWHLGGMMSNGGGNITITHNYLVCDHPVNDVGGGCTGDLNFIPNFASISGVLVQHNLFGANIDASFCTYGGEKSTSPTPHSDHMVYQDNIFQRGINRRCAAYGPVANFDINQPGNQWTNNTWEDGGVVNPEN